MNLKIVEKEDLPLFAEWVNKPEVFGEYNTLRQVSKTEMEKNFEKDNTGFTDFIIEKKNGSKIGFICHFPVVHPAGEHLEIGYSLVPEERGKGYCTEAVEIVVDYLFLSKDIIRVQACTDVRNVPSQKVLERAGFKKEGIQRKGFFCRGEYTDDYIYSILREEWKEPRILTKTT